VSILNVPLFPHVTTQGGEPRAGISRHKGHDLSVIYNNRGAAHMQIGDHEKALDDLSEAIRLDKRYVLARKNRARDLAALGRYAEAILDANVLIQLAPGTADHYVLRADFHERNNALEDAIADYNEAIKRQAGIAQHYHDRGRLLGQLSRHEGALVDLSRAIQLNPRNPMFYFARGLAWFENQVS
jgi:tetratricopeptide (TPR) repeat protein